MLERWTTRSGPRIRFLDNDPVAPRGLPLLFVPGLSDLADEYGELLEFFAPRRTLVIEVRGRGRSEAPETGYTAADHATDLEAVLREEGIDGFHLMTFSRGTTWALELALSDPTRVASLSIGDYGAREVQLTPELVDAQMLSSFRGRPMTERIPQFVFDELAAASRARDLWDQLPRIGCPLLVARAGGKSGILTDADIDRYRHVRPDVEVITVPGAPHDLFRVDRTFYPRAVADFIARHAPDA